MEPPNAEEKRQHLTDCFHHDEPTRPEGFRRVDLLPPEVLEIIFSHLSLIERKNVRQVCSTWYEACNRNEHVHIREENQWDAFRNCRLNKMRVTIDFMNTEWNPTVWREVGARIRTLHLNIARTLRDQTMKNVILFCKNLQALRITLKNRSAWHFCSPSTLQNMNIVQNNLETLIIQKNSKRLPDYRHEMWTNIFIAFLRIFPNVRHCTSGWSIATDRKPFLSFSCSIEPAFTNRSELSSGLAFMMSGSQSDWHRALLVLSTLRFSAVSLVYSQTEVNVTWLKEDFLRTAGTRFFEKQKELVSERVNGGSSLNSFGNKERDLERSVIQRIARHWESLHEQNYDRSGFANPICYRSRIELSDLNPEVSSSIEALLDITISPDKSALHLTWKHEPGIADIYSRNFLMRHEFIEELNLGNDVSDKMLQTIFQFMTCLKSLNICLGRHNTSFGLVGSAGRTSDCSSVKSYSIQRLQRLEHLDITCKGFSFEDSIFDEFNFPKLKYFYCFPPEELTTLGNIILRLPSLHAVGIYDTQQVSAVLDAICPSVREESIIVAFPDTSVSPSDPELKNFFESHPRLHLLHVNGNLYYRDSLL